MSYFCPHHLCEGWQILEGDNFCPNCGGPAQLWDLAVEQLGPRGWVANPVLGPSPARLRVRFQGPAPARLDWLSLPAGVGLDIPERVEPNQELHLAFSLQDPPGHFFLGNLELWYCLEARLRLRTPHGWVDPDAEELEVWLEVLEGAYYLEELPAGWTGQIPLVISQGGQPSCTLRAPRGAQQGPAGLALSAPFAGRLELELPPVWECGWHPNLDLPLLSREGPLQLDWVESSRPGVAVVEWPLQLEAEQGGRIRLHCQQVEAGELELRLRDRLGRRWAYALTMKCSPAQEFPGWVLLDWGSHQVSAALLHSDGHLERLDFSFPGLGRLRQQLGLASWQALSDEFSRLWEALQALPVARGRLFSRLVLTHPVALSPRQLSDFRQAVENGWQGQLVLLPEPLAAAYHFLSESPHLPEGEWRMLLWDVGGSTGDTALLKVKVHHQVAAEVEEVGGDPWFGGQDITALLAPLLRAGEDAEAVKCSHPPRAQLDPLVRARLRLGLPAGHSAPQLLVLSGQGARYPLLAEWLQEQFPGVPLRWCSELKWGVVLGARYAPEVVAWLGPRTVQEGQRLLHFPSPSGQIRCSTRLGLKQQGAAGATFRGFASRGQLLPQHTEWTGVAFVYGENHLEVVENLGWSDDYRTPDGQLNPSLVTLRRLSFHLEHSPEAQRTRLLWKLGAGYELEIEVWEADQCLVRLGPLALW